MSVIVTKMRRNQDGKLTARVSRGDGNPAPVIYEAGIWQTDEKQPRFVLTDVAKETTSESQKISRGI